MERERERAKELSEKPCSLQSFLHVQSIEDSTPSRPSTNPVSPSRVEAAASVTSGPASTSGPLSTTSQEEETPEPDPNATYASVSAACIIVQSCTCTHLVCALLMFACDDLYRVPVTVFARDDLYQTYCIHACYFMLSG